MVRPCHLLILASTFAASAAGECKVPILNKGMGNNGVDQWSFKLAEDYFSVELSPEESMMESVQVFSGTTTRIGQEESGSVLGSFIEDKNKWHLQIIFENEQFFIDHNGTHACISVWNEQGEDIFKFHPPVMQRNVSNFCSHEMVVQKQLYEEMIAKGMTRQDIELEMYSYTRYANLVMDENDVNIHFLKPTVTLADEQTCKDNHTGIICQKEPLIRNAALKTFAKINHDGYCMSTLVLKNDHSSPKMGEAYDGQLCYPYQLHDAEGYYSTNCLFIVYTMGQPASNERNFAHEIGHMLNATHDDDKSCPQQNCLMKPVVVKGNGQRHISLAKKKQIEEKLSENCPEQLMSKEEAFGTTTHRPISTQQTVMTPNRTARPIWFTTKEEVFGTTTRPPNVTQLILSLTWFKLLILSYTTISFLLLVIILILVMIWASKKCQREPKVVQQSVNNYYYYYYCSSSQGDEHHWLWSGQNTNNDTFHEPIRLGYPVYQAVYSTVDR